MVNKWQKLIPHIRERSERVASIAERLFPVRKFLTHVMVHKNKCRFSDRLVVGHKLAVVQDSWLTHLFLKEISDIVGGLPFQIGNKLHLKTHMQSKIEYTRASIAIMDDEFSELVCKDYKGKLRFWKNRLSKQVVRSLNTRGNCEHSLRFDVTNSGIVG